MSGNSGIKGLLSFKKWRYLWTLVWGPLFCCFYGDPKELCPLRGGREKDASNMKSPLILVLNGCCLKWWKVRFWGTCQCWLSSVNFSLIWKNPWFWLKDLFVLVRCLHQQVDDFFHQCLNITCLIKGLRGLPLLVLHSFYK